MRLVSVLITLVFSFSAVAMNQPAKGFPIAGEILSVKRLCPIGVMCITNGTILEIAYELTDSCKKLEPVVTTVSEDGTVLVNATVISEVLLSGGVAVPTFCAQQITTQVETITLNSVYPPFLIDFVGTGAMAEVRDYTK